MKLKRPSGLTLLAGALLLLMPALAALQFRWVGQVSAAEQARMERNLDIAARQFQQAFNAEVFQASLQLSVSPETSREERWHRFAARHEEWFSNTSRPQLVRSIYLVDTNEAGQLQVRRWNNDLATFQPIEWPAVLESWRPDFEQELIDFHSARFGARRDERFQRQDSLLIRPQPLLMEPPPRASGATADRRGAASLVFGFTVIELNMPYIQQEFLPELAQRHFTHEGESYRVTVLDADSAQVIYKSDDSAPMDVASADVVQGLFSGRRGGGPPPRADVNFEPRGGSNQPAAAVARRPDELTGRWRLLVQHESGSLEQAVAGARTKNLALSFGVLMLLTVSIGLLTVTSRRAQRLAQQQMEFVAGVSHELRTPVAVIKSAAENLSQGVVGNAERVKRYGQMIEGEARRLAEMVERVLQYAGIESGLGFGARAPLAPAEIIDSAIDNALPLLGPDTVKVERNIADSLPPVLGDAAALRSAIQNLVANAVKYGGTDRWVGVKAEHVRDRRQVRITVSDHGPGIPAKDLPHIFDPFYRGGDALEQQIHGNGLGLSLVKKIVAAHGGQVSVATRAGAGTAFTIVLPAAEAESRDVSARVRAAVQT